MKTNCILKSQKGSSYKSVINAYKHIFRVLFCRSLENLSFIQKPKMTWPVKFEIYYGILHVKKQNGWKYSRNSNM